MDNFVFIDGSFFVWGGSMKIIEKNCLQGLKERNNLFANIICIKKYIFCIEVRETCNLLIKKTTFKNESMKTKGM